jgi:hypothetical protein
MDILASGDMQNIMVWAQANGVAQVFEKIAAYEIFTNALSANDAFIKNLYAQNLRVMEGAIPQIANALSFDGVNDYVSLGDPVSLQTNNLSVSAWFKTGASGKQIILRKRLAGYSLYINEKIYFGVYENSSSELFCESSLTYNDDTWHNAVGTYDGTTAKLYVDGSLVSTVTGAGTGVAYYAGDLIAIGRDGGNSEFYFNGNIKNVQYFNRCIDATEASALSNNEAVTSGLISKWNLNEGTGLTAYDSVGSNDGTIYGATWVIGKGFRFRAMSDKYEDGSNVPVVDVYAGGEKIFEIDPLTKNITIGEYDSGNGIRWEHSKKRLYVKGHIDAESGTINGQLNTVTIKTFLGGDTAYPQTDKTTIEALVDMLVEFIGSNVSLRIDATINTIYTQSVIYGNIITTQHRILTSPGFTSGGKRVYDGTSAIVCTCSIVFTMEDSSTVTYVLRKIKGTTNRWVEPEPVNYPDYPSPPTSIIDLKGWNNFYIAAGSSTYGTPKKPIESNYDGIGVARSFPYSITDITVWDSTTERLFFENLPTSAPSESGRVWVDGSTLKIVP